MDAEAEATRAPLDNAVRRCRVFGISAFLVGQSDTRTASPPTAAMRGEMCKSPKTKGVANKNKNYTCTKVFTC